MKTNILFLLTTSFHFLLLHGAFIYILTTSIELLLLHFNIFQLISIIQISILQLFICNVGPFYFQINVDKIKLLIVFNEQRSCFDQLKLYDILHIQKLFYYYTVYLYTNSQKHTLNSITINYYLYILNIVVVNIYHES